MKSFAVTTLACLSLNAGLSLAGPVKVENRAACGDSCDTLQSKRNTQHVPRQSSRSKPGSVPYGSIITRCASPGQVALTYDDGPWSYTSQILDTLNSYGVKATFFLNGNGRGQGGFSDPSQPWGDLLKRMNSAGHQLASHTWSHQSLDTSDDATRRSEMSLNEDAFSALLGFYPTYMRAPYLECGGDCQALMNELGYHVISTNLDTKDYENDTPELIQISKDRFSAGLSTDVGSNDYIVLSHDVHFQTVETLTGYMINLATERGYKLVTVGECLGDPSSNWYRSADGGSGSTTPTTPTTPNNPGTPNDSPSTPTFTTVVVETKPTSEPSTSGLTVSPNARCGDDTGYTCIGSAYGDCCGFYGFCGSTETYCGAGCRAGPGKCWTLGDGPKSNTDITDKKTSTDGRCGSAFGGATCEGYGSDHCCSSYGYCGVTSDHCGAGCQSAFGTCN